MLSSAYGFPDPDILEAINRLCQLNRADQQGSDEFKCGAYENKFS